jgi:hypothetical protein
MMSEKGRNLGKMCGIVISLLLILSACNLSSSSQPPPPTPDLPTVRFISPANNARVLTGAELIIDLYAEDNTSGIARIELRIDGVTYRDAATPNLGSPRQFRAEMNWVAESPGLYSFSAIAYRPDGTQSDESFIAVEVVEE